MIHRLILAEAVRILEDAGIREAENDAWLLFEQAFSISRTSYIMKSEEEGDEARHFVYMEMIKKRAGHMPLQYITGKAYFMGYEFEVNESVLIPRFDTEVLVENALKLLPEGSRILDMCTGSGCIAISIALLGGHYVTGADISEKALKTAEVNRKLNRAGNVDFIKSNMFDRIEGMYDCIISNPPYIRTDEIDGLDDEVRKHEPYEALDGHDDGLFFYRILVLESVKYLKKNGLLIMETGYDQAHDVVSMLNDNNYTDIRIIKDLAGFDRVVCGWRK